MDVKTIAEATGGVPVTAVGRAITRPTMETLERELKRLAPALKKLKDL